MPSTVGIVASGASGFSPLDLAPALWLDAADTSFITSSSGLVSQWNDKSGNGRHAAQATAARQPTTGANTINSLNVISFNGSRGLLAPTAQYVNSSNGSWTAFAVFSTRTVASGSGSIVDADDEISPRPSQMLRRTAAGVTSVRVAGGVVTDNAGVTISTNTPYIVSAYQSSSALEVFVNASSNGSSAISGTSATRTSTLAIGYHPFSTLFSQALDGVIGEVIIYSTALSVADRTLVLSYLNAKWAVY